MGSRKQTPNHNQTKTRQAGNWMKSHKMAVGLFTLVITALYAILVLVAPDDAVKIAIGYVVCLVTLGAAIDLTEHNE